jgi:hypothetical protein
LDPRQFDSLPPIQSSGATPWTEYIRKIMTFTIDSVQPSKGSCGLCSFLWAVASVAQKFPVTSRYKDLGFSRPTSSITPIEDGDGFTFATTSSHFIYPTSLSSSTGAEEARCTEDAAAWLVVVKGSNTLERLAYEYEDPARGFPASKLPRNVLLFLSMFIRNTGTWISEVSIDNVSDNCAPIRGRWVDPADVDYTLMRSWLSSCISDYRSCVSSTNKLPIPHMKLIDC